MPAINPNNYNIDFFSTYSFGDITDTSYLSYLFQQNLTDIAPELINSPAGDFQDIYNTEKGLEKDINYTSISNPGSIDEWLIEGNFPLSLLEQAYQNPSQGVGVNQYGPSTLQTFDYENPDLIVEDTGYIGYPTSTGGGVVNNILSEGLDAVGLGGLNNLFLIDFDSPLNDIAKERRLEELKERTKQNFIQETVGKINADPLGLLAGQPLFQQDYSITKRTGLIGGAVNAIGDLTGLQLPISPIPEGAFGQYGTKDTPNDLLDFTGGGTRSLIYDALAINIYGPTIGNPEDTSDADPKSGISNAIKGTSNWLKKQSSGNPAIKTTYLDPVEEVTDFTANLADQQQRPDQGVSIINKKLDNFINGIANKKGVTETLVPIENRPDANGNINPTISDDPTIQYKDLGFDSVETSYEKEIGFDRQANSDADLGHLRDYQADLNHKRAITLDDFDTKVELSRDANKWYWSDTTDTKSPRNVRRGLLKYTQSMIDQQIDNKQGAARFIGLPNSDKNYENGSESGKHKEMSMGNLVKTPDGNFYCRSWSVRHGYNKYNDLIRSDALWREFRAGTVNVAGEKQAGRKFGSYSTLREPGIPKIAYEHDDLVELEIKKARIDNRVGKLKSITPDSKYIIPYMFSIENLAWKDSPHWHKLPNCEQGPHGGRIMWFPPYNINFTDNTSVNWDTTNFIGRAEPIYTYNTTERTGTLSFTVVVDHPSIVNALKEKTFSTTRTDEDGNTTTVTAGQNLETFFAGCDAEEIREIMNRVPEINPIEEIPDSEPIPETEIVPIKIQEIPDILSFHFKNAKDFSKEGSSEDGYQNIKDTFHKAITTNSSCKDKGTIGRCFDYNYESNTIEWFDNPVLYMGGDNEYGGDGSCPKTEKGTPFPEASDGLGYRLIPGTGTSSRNMLPPCKGKGGGKNDGDFKPYGANTNASSRDTIWVRSGNGGGYSNINYCCDLELPSSGYTFSGTVITDFSKYGFYEYRYGANQRFWGSGLYPFEGINDTKLFASPVLDLPLPSDYEYSFIVDIGPSGVEAGKGISQLIEFLATTPEGKNYTIQLGGNCSAFASPEYNKKLGIDRSKTVYDWMLDQMKKAEDQLGVPELDYTNDGVGTLQLFSEKEGKLGPIPTTYTNDNEEVIVNHENSKCKRWKLVGRGKKQAEDIGFVGDDNQATKTGEFTPTPSASHPGDFENTGQVQSRRVDIKLIPNSTCLKSYYDELQKEAADRAKDLNEEAARQVEEKRKQAQAEFEKEKELAKQSILNMVNECDYFMKIKEEDSFLYESLKDKLKNFHPAFHSITPEGFNKRINFLQQCGRQGPSFIDPNQPQNTAFGRPPVCILRLGDFYFTKIIIDSINFTFDPLQWDLNPEGIGVQPMLVNVDLNFKFIGGSTLQGPLTQLQNAVSYNFFANTAVYMPLEKILTRRGKAGELLVEGLDFSGLGDSVLSDTFGDGSAPRTYYYGPWASPTELDDTINGEQRELDRLAEEEAEREAAELAAIEARNNALVEQNCGAYGGKGRVLTEEEVIQNSPPNRTSISDTEPDGAFYISAESLVDYPLEDYYWIFCEGSAPSPYPKEGTNPLNKDENESDVEQQQEEEKLNGQSETNSQTTEEGQLIFRETASLRYKNGQTYSNAAGEITISGNFMDVEIIGTSGRFSSNIDPQSSATPDIGKILPQWVYGGLNNDIVSDWNVSITSERFIKSLEGDSYQSGGSNEAVVWDSINNNFPYQKEKNPEAYNFEQKYNTCCEVDANNLPTTQVGKKLFAFNIIYSLTGYYDWEEWKEDYKEDPDLSLIKDMEDLFEKDPNKESIPWSVSYYIQADENKKISNDQIVNGESRKSEGGSIKIYGKITKEGLEQIKQLLS